jgi:hypothetical protein
VLSIIKNPQKWSFDCAEYVQVIIWSTILNVNGKEKFDEYINSLLHENAIACIERYFTLLPHNSTGIIQEKKYSRYSDPDEEFMDESSFMFIETSENELLQQVPIGTRIAVKNVRAPENSAYRYENAIKLTNSLYGAHGLETPKLSLSEIKDKLGMMTYLSESEDIKSNISFKEYVNRYIFVAEIETYKLEIK